MTAIAGQTHDLVLDADGFMLAQSGKGTTHYRRSMAGKGQLGLTPGSDENLEVLQGQFEGVAQPFRRAIWSKWSGLGQGMVAGADGWQLAQKAGKVNDLVSLRPVQAGGALALVPQGVSAVAEAGAIGPNNVFTVAVGNVQVVSFDAKIFVSANPGTNNSGFVLKATAAAPLTGMCLWNGAVLVTEGTTLKTFNPATGALTAFAPAQSCSMPVAYQGVLVAQSGAQLFFLINGSWVAGPILENAITAFEELNGSLYIGTLTALYRLDGVLQPKSPATAPNTLDYFNYKIAVVWRTAYFQASYFTENNFTGMTGWKGYLWFFAGARLYRAAPVQGHDTMQPEIQPVFGLSLGLRVCGNLLVAITRPDATANSTIWANDGEYDLAEGLGWFKVTGEGYWFHPFPNAGYSQGMLNAASYNPGTNTTFGRWLFDPVTPVGWRTDNFGVARAAVSGQVTLPLVTPEDFAALAGDNNGKVLSVKLRRVGVEWSLIDGGKWWPEIPPGGPTLSAFDVAIEISNTSGVSWTTLVEPSLGHLTLNLFWFYGNRIELPLPPGYFNEALLYPAAPPAGGPIPFGPVTDMGWLVRVTWGGLVMPLLRRVWLDFDAAEVQPQTGRAWEFEVNLQDPQIGLQGGFDPAADANSRIVHLTNLVKSGQTVDFSDLDGQSYRVKVVGFDLKQVAQGALPALNPGWQGTVRLEEVWAGN